MEIKAQLNLNEEEGRGLATHSFLNVVSIIGSVCYLIELEAGKDGLLANNIKMSEGLKKLLTDEKALLEAL